MMGKKYQELSWLTRLKELHQIFIHRDRNPLSF